MNLIETGSLSTTLDAVNAAYFDGRLLAPEERKSVARWIVRRQGPAGARADRFDPGGGQPGHFRLFTGERLRTDLAARNVLWAEAYRALALLGVRDARVQAALANGDRSLQSQCFAAGCIVGECAHSSVAYWRYLAAMADGDRTLRLGPAVQVLQDDRDGRGDWPSFPFYYTLLALLEMNTGAARAELGYAAPACARRLKLRPPEDPYGERRRKVMERALALC